MKEQIITLNSAGIHSVSDLRRALAQQLANLPGDQEVGLVDIYIQLEDHTRTESVRQAAAVGVNLEGPNYSGQAVGAEDFILRFHK